MRLNENTFFFLKKSGFLNNTEQILKSKTERIKILHILFFCDHWNRLIERFISPTIFWKF